MFIEEVIIQNENGIHARPASIIVKRAMTYKSNIKLIHNNTEYDAKRIISIMKMAADKGDKLTVIADGIDEVQAGEDIVKLIRYEVM